MRIWPASYFAVKVESFNCFFFPFLAAVDRRRRMLSEMTMNKRKESFAIWNMYSLLRALKYLLRYQVYFNTFFIKNQERIRCALVNILGTNNHNLFFFFWRSSPQWARASLFTRFLDHTQRRTTVGRTPLDEWSARRRNLYRTTHNTQNRQTSMPLVGVEPTISARERPQTYALDRGATTTGTTITH